MIMKTIKHPSFVRLLKAIIDDTPSTESGTYNKMDPTAFEKGEVEFDYKGNHFVLNYNDCTWGITITICKFVKRYPKKLMVISENMCWVRKKIAEFYLDDQNQAVYPRQRTLCGMPGLLGRVFKHCFRPDFVSAKQREYERQFNYVDDGEPMTCPSCYI